jgi:hypothetical protein
MKLMTAERFKQIFYILEEQPIFNDLPQEELEKYFDIRESDTELREWLLNEKIKKSGLNVPVQCCVEMRYHLVEHFKSQSNLKDIKEINYDEIIVLDKTRNSYGIPIHDGGTSYVKIRYCPWCGKKL